MSHMLPPNCRSYAVSADAFATDFAISSTYYWGAVPTLPALTSPNLLQILLPTKGFVKDVTASFLVLTTVGTSENSTLSLRHNDVTDYEISNVVKFDASYQKYFKSNLNFLCAADDFLEMKLVTPAWVTAPLGTYVACKVTIQGG